MTPKFCLLATLSFFSLAAFATDKNDPISSLENYAQLELENRQSEFREDLIYDLENAGFSEDEIGFVLNRTTPLADQFTRLNVGKYKSRTSSSREACYTFQDYFWNAVKRDGDAMQSALRQQFLEVSYFLKEMHRKSLGRQASILFNINRVELCDIGDMPRLDFHVLRIPVSSNSQVPGYGYYSAEDLLEMWHDGRIVFGEKLSTIGEIREYFKDNKGAIILNRLSKAWPLVNPIGDVRHRLRIAIQRYFMQESPLADMKNLSKSDVQSLFEGSRAAETIDLDQNKLSEAMNESLSTAEVADALSAILLRFVMGNDLVVENIDNRDLGGGIFNFTNNKQVVVNVDLSALSTKSSQIESIMDEQVREDVARQNRVTLENNVVMDGWIDISPVDQVVVNLTIPLGLTKLMERFILLERLNKAQDRAKRLVP